MAVVAKQRRWDQESLQELFGIHGTVREQERAPFDSQNPLNPGVVDISHRGTSSMATITVPKGGGVIFGSDITPSRGAQHFSRYPGLSRFFTWSGWKGKLSGENVMLKSYFNNTTQPQQLGIDDVENSGLIAFDLAKAPEGIVAPSGSLVMATIPTQGEGPDIDFRYKPLMPNTWAGDPAWKQHLKGKGTAILEAYGATDITLVPPGESVPIDPKRLVAYDGGLTRTFGLMTRNASSVANAMLHKKEPFFGFYLQNTGDRDMFVVTQAKPRLEEDLQEQQPAARQSQQQMAAARLAMG